MTQTTTAISSCNVRIELDDEGGVAQDISGSSNRANLTFNRQIGSANTFEGEYPIRIECKKDAALELAILYTRVNNEGRQFLEDWYQAGGKRTLSIYPYGQDTGNRQYTGDWRLQEFAIPLDVSNADPVVVTATLVPDGAIDFAAWSS